MPSPIDLGALDSVDDSEDPRITEAAEQVVDGLRALMDSLGPAVAAALYDAIADRLDVLCDDATDAAEAELEEDDDELLEEDDGEAPELESER